MKPIEIEVDQQELPPQTQQQQKAQLQIINIYDLPNILIKNITSYLDDIDKICLLLSSKKTYQFKSFIDIISYSNSGSIIYNNTDNNNQQQQQLYNKHGRKYIKYRTSPLHLKIPRLSSSNFREDENSEITTTTTTTISNTTTSTTTTTTITINNNNVNKNRNYIVEDLEGLKQIPKDTKYLVFSDSFNGNGIPFNDVVIPGSVCYLKFGALFNPHVKIPVGFIPDSVTRLTFGNGFNRALSVGVIPKSVKRLKFGDDFNHPLGVGVLPPMLTRLTLGRDFNYPLVKGVIPGSCTHLTLGHSFNQSIKNIPSSVTHLSVKHFDRYQDFSQPKIKDLPASVTQLNYDTVDIWLNKSDSYHNNKIFELLWETRKTEIIQLIKHIHSKGTNCGIRKITIFKYLNIMPIDHSKKCFIIYTNDLRGCLFSMGGGNSKKLNQLSSFIPLLLKSPLLNSNISINSSNDSDDYLLSFGGGDDDDDDDDTDSDGNENQKDDYFYNEIYLNNK
eukprot:gene7641-9399_t